MITLADLIQAQVTASVRLSRELIAERAAETFVCGLLADAAFCARTRDLLAIRLRSRPRGADRCASEQGAQR
jgi:hypothetical protein